MTTSTTGADLDPDGYTVTLDGTTSQPIPSNSSGVTFPNVSAGGHSVALSGVASNCSVSGGISHSVTIRAGQPNSTAFSVSCTPIPPTTGSIKVTTSTSGSDLDPDGYTVTVDAGNSQSIPTNSSDGVTFINLSAGNHPVVLSGMASNCTVTGGDTHTVSVIAGQTVSTAFSVTCAATTGALKVTTSTSGSDQDPDGYTVTVDGSTSQSIATNSGSSGVVLSGLSPNNHSVELTGVASNCAVSGANPRTVSVTAGATASTAFSVSCTALPTTGSITVTTHTSGENQPSGYTVTVDAGPTQSVAASGTVTFNGLSVANHSVGLSPIPSNCSVSDANPQTVAVTAGNTTTVSFSISCTAPPPPQDHAPVVNAGGGGTILIGSFTLDASFTDQDHDGPWSYSIDWDDGSSPERGTAPSEGPITKTHSYGLELLGKHNVTVTVTDSHGLSGSDVAVVTVVASL
ncbi:MAG: hypothetical protein DMD45_14890 [Gemmatimonadetes bacterium]|nr:MAG: hypothetical protein DMD45_14890 [Gemmatimonadota bacterium]